MWRLTETARMQVNHHEREGEAFVCQILAIDGTGCRPCEPELKRESNQVASPRITNPMKVSTVIESKESHVHCSVRLRGILLAQLSLITLK
jgi:hypothetical protein